MSFFGREQLDLWELVIKRSMKYCSEHAHNEKNFFDVQYSDFSRYPVGVARNIPRDFGIPLDDAAEQAMQQFMAENRQGKHGTHKYTLGEFGLDRDGIYDRFGEYLQTYQVSRDAQA